MGKTKEITPSEYAAYRGCTLQNITLHLRKGNKLPDVIKIKKYSRFYVLVVPAELKIPLIEMKGSVVQ